MDNSETTNPDRKEYFRLYMREWRRKNPEKVKKAAEDYWARRLQRQQQVLSEPSGK